MSGFPQVPPEVVAALAKENRSPQIIGLVAAFTGLGLACVLLRFYVRIRLIRLVGMEDYFTAVSIIFSICSSVCLIQGARYGNGKHLINVPMENGTYILKYLFFSIIAYHVSLTSTKLSILLQYRRIFTLQGARIPIYIVMGLCLACGITAIVTAIFTCVPVDAYWNMMKKPFAQCVNQDLMYHANAGLNIVTDLLVAALPIRQLWKLQIALRQKIALIMVMTLGWFVVIVSIIRLTILIDVAKHPTDTTWYSGPAAYWSAIEVNLAIVCASAPALKPLVIKVAPMFGSTKRSNSTTTATSQATHDQILTANGPFTRLKTETSKSSMNDDIVLESHVAAVPQAHRQHSQDTWKEIHVMRDVEQRFADR